MNKFFSDIAKKFVWQYRQPLTYKPDLINSVVSDLFIWRNSDDWKTFFDLTNFYSIFTAKKTKKELISVIFFNSEGCEISRADFRIEPFKKNTIDLSSYLKSTDNAYGTFAVFHKNDYSKLLPLGSYVSERGYVSYKHVSSSIRMYTHGNIDAIASNNNNSIQMLGGKSFLLREYNLQTLVTVESSYSLIVTNPTNKSQIVNCALISSVSKKVIKRLRAKIHSRGCFIFEFKIDKKINAFFSIQSYIVMARPIVFRLHKDYFDVFHG